MILMRNLITICSIIIITMDIILTLIIINILKEAYANVTSIRHSNILPKLSILTIIVFNVVYEKSVLKIICLLILHQMQFLTFFIFYITMTHTHIHLCIFIN